MISVHPFPARMAPELALATLSTVRRGGVVLDPMTGSGTVAQQARSLGLSASAFDLDPLAVLISKVATTPVLDRDIAKSSEAVLEVASALYTDAIELPWIDRDESTKSFIAYWFGSNQIVELRKISHVLSVAESLGIDKDVANVLRVGLSRIIITKTSSASLAQDTSHSRPHRVRTESEYNVFSGFSRSIKSLRKRVSSLPTTGSVFVDYGDARKLAGVADETIDVVLTSPPYLNAIDYMRGHKMSLVWLGHSLSNLSNTRSSSIGAEKKADPLGNQEVLASVRNSMRELSLLPSRHSGMLDRYILDLHAMLLQTKRVLKPRGQATFVMGNSCLKGVYIENSSALIKAGQLAGLSLVDTWERDLPANSRYLPVPEEGTLSKRMRKEVIVRLERRR